MHNALQSTSLTNTVFAFGSSCGASYGMMVFRNGGGIAGYHHANEARWRIDDDSLIFTTRDGIITSKLERTGSSHVFIGSSVHNRWPLYILPVLAHDPRRDCSLPNVLINSLPKSGTYFAEQVLSKLGWLPTRFHLVDGGAIDDYRGLPDEEMHVAPEAVRVPCPMRCLGAILGRGEIVVGHLSSEKEVSELTGEGLVEIRLIRNLRDIVLSLFKFKRDKVRAHADEDWRTVDHDLQLFEFLKCYMDKDVNTLMKQCTHFLQNNSFMTIRFEDLLAGNAAELEAWYESIGGNSRLLQSSIAEVSCSNTPTWSGGLSNWRDFWSESLEDLFVDSGLHELNVRLGYH